MPKINYSDRVYASLGNKLDKAIIDSVESSPEMKREIARVCQQANRRAQNLEKANVYSPALRALEEMGKSGYTKFSASGSWSQAKQNYAQAIAFLNQPTSTVTGAKQYVKAIAQREGLDYNTTNAILRAYDDMRYSNPTLQAKLEYYPQLANIMGDVNRLSREMYETSEEYAQALQEEIERQAQELTSETVEILQDFVGGLRMF